MAFVDDVERCGRAVEAGEMTAAAGRWILIAASPGPLTEEGAADLLAKWQQARGLYAGEFSRAAALMDKCWGFE